VNDFTHFPDWALFEELERRSPNWQWRSYGGHCRNGVIGPASKLADRQRDADFIFQVKAGGDGYGHIVHNAAAVGRPMIVKRSYYRNMLGEALMIPGETCIDIDNKSPAQILDEIEYWAEPIKYAEMQRKIRENFERNVDFESEFTKIHEFLSRLK
jgi:hypothetical protein